MSPRRAPSAPPEIPGFTFVRLLGSGGFADVFLYDQQMPRRRVAVKVLLSDAMTADARDTFYAEANLMAQLSTHPSIVTIYQAGIASDGRPYLAMEYCSRPNLGARFRTERVGVAEALRIGAQIAGAVETSHRAGILHRDIKPANILVTEYNRPALTDFGIASSLAETSRAESLGMSIPWSPPESFQSPPEGYPSSDVYALGATIYSLLAGRAPFEVPGSPNSGLDLIERIDRGVLPPMGRADVPDELERVLATAMARTPSSRYATALDFGRALQQVQLHLQMSVTTIDLLDDEPAGAVDDEQDEDDANTRIRALVSIDPGDTSRRRAPLPPRDEPAAASPTRVDPAADGVDPDDTVLRQGGPPTAGVVAGAAMPTDDGATTRAAASASIDPASIDPATEYTSDATVLRPRASAPTSAPKAAPGSAPPTSRADVVDTIPGAAPAPVGAPTTSTPAAPRTARRSRTALVISAVVLVVAIAGGVAIALTGGVPSISSATDAPADDTPADAVPQRTVPQPSGLIGQNTDAGVVFTWTNPEPQDGDLYLWTTVEPGAEPTTASTKETTVTVPPSATGRTCIEVQIRRVDGRASTTPATGCAE